MDVAEIKAVMKELIELKEDDGKKKLNYSTCTRTLRYTRQPTTKVQNLSERLGEMGMRMEVAVTIELSNSLDQEKHLLRKLTDLEARARRITCMCTE